MDLVITEGFSLPPQSAVAEPLTSQMFSESYEHRGLLRFGTSLSSRQLPLSRAVQESADPSSCMTTIHSFVSELTPRLMLPIEHGANTARAP